MANTTGLAFALNRLRLPPHLHVTGLSRTTRPSKAALHFLRSSEVKLRQNAAHNPLIEVQQCLEAAAPALLRPEVDMDGYLRRAQEGVLDEGGHRLVGEEDLHAFMDRNLIKPVNVLVDRVLSATQIKPHWHSQLAGTNGVTRPDWSCAIDKSGRLATIASAELKTDAAIGTLSPITDAFRFGCLKLDENKRSVLGLPGAIDPSKPRRRNGLEHVIDQCLTQMVDADVSLALITNYRSFLLVDGGTEADHRVVSFAPLVSVASASTPAALYDSPLGLLLGVTLAALRRRGIRLDTL